MSRTERDSSDDLIQKFQRLNVYSVDNIGNQLQSIWETSKELPAFTVEQKRLDKVFKEIHWLYRLGRDIYIKTLDELDKQETLWAMGPILYICFRLAAEEGDVGIIANQLRTDYYQMIVLLRKHHDQLETESKRITTHSHTLKINDPDDSHYEPLSSSTYSSYRSSSLGYDPFPDYYWWQGLGDGVSGHTDPLMSWVSPGYSTGNVWGYAVRLQVNMDVQLFHLAQQGVTQLNQVVFPELKHLGETALQGVDTGIADLKEVGDTVISGADRLIQGAEHGINVIQGDVSGCCHQMLSGAYNCCNGIGSSLSDCFGGVYHCGQGVCNMLGDCLSGCCNFLSCCSISSFNCNCNCSCDGGGGGGSDGGGLCCCGVGCCGAIGTWLSKLCGCTSSDPTSTGGDGHNLLLDHNTLGQGGSHLSIQASDVISKTWGTLFTGLYMLTFTPPLIVTITKNFIKFVSGGEREETSTADRISATQDFLCGGALGTGLFFAWLFIPYGGIHSAMTAGLFGALLGDNLSHKARKKSRIQEHGGFRDKVGKYVPTQAQLQELYLKYEETQPGLDLSDRCDHFSILLTGALDEKSNRGTISLPGRSQPEFLTAQEELEKVALLLSNGHQIAYSEKREALSNHGIMHGLRGLVKSYGHLFHRHYAKTELREQAVGAVRQALKEQNLDGLTGLPSP